MQSNKDKGKSGKLVPAKRVQNSPADLKAIAEMRRKLGVPPNTPVRIGPYPHPGSKRK